MIITILVMHLVYMLCLDKEVLRWRVLNYHV